MNTDQLERELREALTARADALPATAGSRVRAHDYRPRTRSVRPPVAAGALTAAAVAGAAVWVVALSSQTPSAFAGWSATPTAGSPGEVRAAESACRQQLTHTPPAMAKSARVPGAARARTSRTTSILRHRATTPGTGSDAGAGAMTPGPGSGPGAGAPPGPDVARMRPVLADTRGPFTWAIFAGSASTASCISGPSLTVMSASGGVDVTAPADKIALSSSAQTQTPKGAAYSFVEGRAGSGVIAATLVLDDGTHVQATLQNGWFVAWWPGDRTARSALVTTSTGTTTQALAAHAPGCPRLPRATKGMRMCMSGVSTHGGARGARTVERSR